MWWALIGVRGASVKLALALECMHMVAQKSKPPTNDQIIVLKPVSEIRLIRQIKV